MKTIKAYGYVVKNDDNQYYNINHKSFLPLEAATLYPDFMEIDHIYGLINNYNGIIIEKSDIIKVSKVIKYRMIE